MNVSEEEERASLVRVGLGRGPNGYDGIEAPWPPQCHYPEFDGFKQNLDDVPSNHVFSAVRDALIGMGLDAENRGSSHWNPLSSLASKGQTIVLKPNFIRHWNPESSRDSKASVESVITHGAIVRAVADFAFLAVGSTGRVVIAEAAQQDCDFEIIRELTGLDQIQAYFRDTHNFELEIIDLRRETVQFKDGVIVSRRPLPGDPKGYRAVDLGSKSFFTNSGLDPNLFRGADYDPGPTSEHHSKGRNAYLLSETVLSADLIINLPKLKTHKKTGVTLALKNMVGINGDKNWLPHHSAGGVAQGGDEFPGSAFLDRARSRLVEMSRSLLGQGKAIGIARRYRKFEIATRGDDFIRSGNWYGNQTTWRMCGDLNRCVYYSDRRGVHLEASSPVRTVLTIIDAIVAGQGNGPLATNNVPLGVVLASTDPIAVDLAAVRLMNFDPNRISKIHEIMRAKELPITQVKRISDVQIGEPKQKKVSSELEVYALTELQSEIHFTPHPGWKGHIENV